MAYVRWSSVLNTGLTSQDEIDFINNYTGTDSPANALFDYQRSQPHSEISEWYIYWDALDEDHNDRNLQRLCLMCNGNKSGFVDSFCIDYPELRVMYDRDNWSALGNDVPQLSLVRECVERWLTNVEKEYPE